MTEKDYSHEEEYIRNECSEISVGEAGYTQKLLNLFPALRNRNYRIYFAGQLISLIGTWLQVVAEGWLVLQLTHSPFFVGLVTALALAPTLLLSLFGGVIVDRFPKKNVLFFTQTAAMILAFTLGILTVTRTITILIECILAFTLGVVNAIDSPARQSFVPEIVDKEHLSSAIALNSGAFNAARVVGPAVAGVLIAVIGTGGAFILNGISYIAVLIALYFMNIKPYVNKHQLHPIAAIKEGLKYSFTHPIIRTLLIFVGVVSIFGWSYSTEMPYIAEHVFHQNAAGLGYLYVATGLGALLATFLVSGFSNKVSPIAFIIGGNTLFAASIIAFSFTSQFHIALILLFCGGFGLLSAFATMNTTIQHMVTNEVRGRVMSVYTLFFLGFAPLGNFLVGVLSEKFGTHIAIRIGSVIVLLFGLLVLYNRQRISSAYTTYKEERNL